MKRFVRGLAVGAAVVGLAVLAGCGATPSTGGKSGDKMKDDKMSGDKMKDDKMGGDKMKDDKMGGDKMKDEKK